MKTQKTDCKSVFQRLFLCVIVLLWSVSGFDVVSPVCLFPDCSVVLLMLFLKFCHWLMFIQILGFVAFGNAVPQSLQTETDLQLNKVTEKRKENPHWFSPLFICWCIHLYMLNLDQLNFHYIKDKVDYVQYMQLTAKFCLHYCFTLFPSKPVIASGKGKVLRFSIILYSFIFFLS